MEPHRCATDCHCLNCPLPPPVNAEALWVDGNGSSFYAYDGGVSWIVDTPRTPPANGLWQFRPSGASGSWESIGVPASSNFSLLGRVDSGYYASGNGLGLALEGSQSATTTFGMANIYDFIPVPGLVMFNSTSSSQKWYNLSSTGYTGSGVALSGAAHFVPTFGTDGLLLVLGGCIGSVDALASMDSITIFDPQSQEWSVQTTSGDKPAPLQNPCVVGLQGDNNTYEVSILSKSALFERSH